MFETIKKARQLGVIALERMSDYLELLKVSAEIQGQNFMRRIIGALVVALLAVLSLIFLGIAIIVTCWDTPYRVISAWGVAGTYALIAFGTYIASPGRTDSVSAFDTLRNELQQDVKLMKDVV
ncbi:phage holin family protein [Nitrosovibrio tenuis]|uniref:Putative Holin-X, holin superfamily III n=1 Tax=Nitrosovibrio tenuis TaxID=1233 RepID=A0A1H7GWT5_9PROT|nr:phage holin family protein [Nitrosovibrio tenuis]SEK41100.1 Putative Holin-X, holin superfamily III [Nitrosovibrio tenuis]